MRCQLSVFGSVPAEHFVLGAKVLKRLNRVNFATSVKKMAQVSAPSFSSFHRQEGIAEPPNEAMLIDLESIFHTAGITLLVESVPHGYADFALALEDKPGGTFTIRSAQVVNIVAKRLSLPPAMLTLLVRRSSGNVNVCLPLRPSARPTSSMLNRVWREKRPHLLLSYVWTPGMPFLNASSSNVFFGMAPVLPSAVYG